MSWGCVVVPVAFYLEVVQPVLGQARSVVCVMPDRAPVRGLMRTAQQR